ncbi:MAG TPA: Gfo/Idh/MocA family oxidoreductase [Planctomycetota bacterium]|nr:Gfo/Idh/MocA family oxidoreductase [Planctomycetota bacterium]
MRIGIIGCGNIAPAYLTNLTRFDGLTVAAVADLDVERAKARATEFKVPRACTPGELLRDDDIDLVVNLTIPKAHAPVGMLAVKAGKHVYSEKPLGLDRVEGKKLIAAAKAKRVRVGCAPDTVLGAGIQCARAAIDAGSIGKPVAATAFMMSHGPENWHPDPTFVYARGGGPLFDMGPYYVAAFITLFGPVKRVTGSARITFPKRMITSKPKYGQMMKVEVPTHVVGVLEFASGAVVNLITSFDVWHHSLPNIEVHGTEGSMQVPDPNGFGGTVRVRRHDEAAWRDLPLVHRYADNGRGIGVADMVAAIREKRPHRASGEMALHVVDVMQAIVDASAKGRHITPTTTCKQPAAMPVEGLAAR